MYHGEFMTIHHDKMAYGKLDNLSEKFSEDRLKKMAELLSSKPGKDCGEGKKDGQAGDKEDK